MWHHSSVGWHPHGRPNWHASLGRTLAWARAGARAGGHVRGVGRVSTPHAPNTPRAASATWHLGAIGLCFGLAGAARSWQRRVVGLRALLLHATPSTLAPTANIWMNNKLNISCTFPNNTVPGLSLPVAHYPIHSVACNQLYIIMWKPMTCYTL